MSNIRTTVTASQRILLVTAQLALCRLVLTHSGDVSDRAENFNMYVRAVRHVAGALD